MSDFAAVTQAIVDSTSTALRTVASGAEKLAPHAANALATRAVVSFVIPAFAFCVLAALTVWMIRKAESNKPDGDDEIGVLAIFPGSLSLACLVSSFVALGDAAAAWRDPVGYMILTLLGK